MKTLQIGTTWLRLVQGDITEQAVDAVVNAANTHLTGGAGVNGAIHRRGGPTILEACQALRRERFPDGLPTGEATITTGGNLPARHVIHAVGPIWRGGKAHEETLLANAYRNALEQARLNSLRTVAFPAISTGIFGFPIAKATPLALRTTAAYIRHHPDAFIEIRFILFSPDDFQTYQTHLAALEA